MADATMNVLVLRRRKNGFTPKPSPQEPTPEEVTYFEAWLFDVDTEQLHVFRSRDEAVFAGLEKSKVVTDFTARVDGVVNVQAQLLRPAGGDAGFGGQSF